MGASERNPGPFSLSLPGEGSILRWFADRAGRGAESLLGLSRLNVLHAECAARFANSDGLPYCDVALAELDVRVRAPSAEVARIPASGPVVVVGNHPFGALEGLALESLVRRARADVRILANHLLARIPEIRGASIFVDPFGGAAAHDRNARPLREAIEWLRRGGVLIVFPAGEVASFNLRERRIVEPRWSPNVARIVRRTSATVVPMYIEGRNGVWFHAAGQIHPRLRTALLPREFLRKRGSEIHVRVGTPIPPERVHRFKDARDAIDYLRLRTMILGVRSSQVPSNERGGTAGKKQPAIPAIISAEDPRAVDRELRGLPTECLLLESGDFQVFAAYAAQIPVTLREIGRLREVTFRAVGEGTGKSSDVDRFDSHYLHLFAWDRAARRLVGAYRLGFTADLLADQGLSGLYTHTLFQYDARWVEQIGPAIELGRSFVTAEYQKSYAALLLLWKGIARIVSGRPECRRLFGVVSVSAEFDSMTQRLLMSFLRVNNYNQRLAGLVVPRTPPKHHRRQAAESERLVRLAESIDDVDELVREIESHERSVPVLLRQYLKLDAQVLGFNIDPEFGNVLDALMLIDLTRTPRPILDRFFGRAEAEAFLGRHTEAAVSVG